MCLCKVFVLSYLVYFDLDTVQLLLFLVLVFLIRFINFTQFLDDAT